MSVSASKLLDRLVQKARRLCSLPSVAMRVLELTSNPRVDTWALKECIENDPALTSRILRVVNSSLFGLAREVSDLNQALALLGSKPLKLLVLGFSLPTGLFAGISGQILGRYWRRTLTKAVAARELAGVLCTSPGDEAFIAGLLQDVGMLVLIQEVGTPYVRFVEKVFAAGTNLAEMERRSLGFSHVALSAQLLSHWGLPAALIDAIGWDPQTPTETAPAAAGGVPEIMHLAELATRLLVDGETTTLVRLLETGARRHGLSEEQLEAVVATLEHKVRQLADVLSLKLPPGVEYRDVLVRAQAQLAEVAADVAGDCVRNSPHTAGLGVAEIDDAGAVLAEAVYAAAGTGVRPPAAAAVSGHGAGRPTRGTKRQATVAEQPAPGAASVPGDVAGLDDAGLVAHVDAAVAVCRHGRCPLSLMLVEVHDLGKLLQVAGLPGIEAARQLVEQLCRQLDHPELQRIGYGEAAFALLFPDCDRRHVLRFGKSIIDAVRSASTHGHSAWEQVLAVNVGSATVALPPKNFPAADLIAAAERCVYSSRATGGAVMKSIEIY